MDRQVISAQLQPANGPQPFAMITWNCSVYDQLLAITGVGVVLGTRSFDALGNAKEFRSDGSGRALESHDQEDRWEPVSTTADFECSLTMAKG